MLVLLFLSHWEGVHAKINEIERRLLRTRFRVWTGPDRLWLGSGFMSSKEIQPDEHLSELFRYLDILKTNFTTEIRLTKSHKSKIWTFILKGGVLASACRK